MKLYLDITLVVGSVNKLNKFKYGSKEPTEIKEEVVEQMSYVLMPLSNKEVRELKKYLTFCKREGFDVLEFTAREQKLKIKVKKLKFKDNGDEGLLPHECEIMFDLPVEVSPETCKYSTEYLHKILGSFKLAEIDSFEWGFKTDGILKLVINGEEIVLAPRYECD